MKNLVLTVSKSINSYFLHQFIINMYEGTLDNGLRWLSIPEKGDLIAVLVIFGVGSRDEPTKHSGISHFLEHMFFKGSKKYPDNVEAFKEFDAIGARFNAYTNNDQTGYHIKFYKDHVDKILSIISDAVKNPLLRLKDIDKERTVVFEELDMIEDDPNLQVHQMFSKAIFEGHPLGQSLGGTKATLKRVGKAELHDYHDKYYCPSNAIIVLVGDLNKKTSESLIKKYFNSGWKNKDCRNYKPRFFESKRKKPLILLEKDNTDQDHIILGFPSFGYYDKRRYPTELLNVILGSTFTSRLFVEVREKRGLVYGIRSGLTFFEEGGYFYIRSATNKKNVYKVLEIVLKLLQNIKKKPVSVKELKRAKTHLEGSGRINETNIMNLALFYGIQKMYCQTGIITYDEYMTKINKVTRQDVQNVANDIIDFNKIVIAIVGESNKKTVEKIISKFV